MARFAVFETAEAPVCPASSTPSPPSPPSPPPPPQAPIPNPNPSSSHHRSESHSSITTTSDRPSSSPWLSLPSTNPQPSDPCGSTNLLAPLKSHSSGSMRSSHSDTNLMERFRSCAFMTNLVGSSRKSFTLYSKRKSKKEKKIKSTTTTTITSDAVTTANQTLPETSNHHEVPTIELDPVSSVATLNVDDESSDQVLSGEVKPSTSNDQCPQATNQNDELSKPSNRPVVNKCTTKQTQPPLRSPSGDSLPDVFVAGQSSPTQQTQQSVSATELRTTCRSDLSTHASGPSHHRLVVDDTDDSDTDSDEALHSSLNASAELELIFRPNRVSTPNRMISLNGNSRTLSLSERERELYLEEASGEAEVNQLLATHPPTHLASIVGLPTDEEQFNAWQRIMHNSQHQQAPQPLALLSTATAMTSFASRRPQSRPDLDRYTHTFAAYTRMLAASGATFSGSSSSRPNHASGGLDHLDSSASAVVRTNVANTSAPAANALSISSLSALPYPPPALLFAQRRAHSAANPAVHTQIDYINCLVPDLRAISSCSFYWGKMDRYEAERLLDGKPEGTFLLRDSAQEEHMFSVSFRRFDRSLHARIEQWKHRFSFDSHDPGVFSSPTVTGLIEHYKDPSHCMFFEPMLTRPLNRPMVFSLSHLVRATICDHITYDAVNDLPLPIVLLSYLKEYHYRQKVRTKHFDEFTYQHYFHERPSA